MFLSIKEMEVRKVRFVETFEPGQIDFQGAEVEQAGPLQAEGVAELLANTDGEVRIRGKLAVRLKAPCDRCLGEAIMPLEADLDLFYRPMSYIARDEEIEIDEGEAEIGFYEGEGMELEDILREQILLLLPMQRVCREDCKGICPLCGRNRNETACQCKAETVDDRWKALRDI
jgi:uncharacterized protein